MENLEATMAFESAISSDTKDPRTLCSRIEICHLDGTSMMTIRRLFVEKSMSVGQKSGLQDLHFTKHQKPPEVDIDQCRQ